MKAGISIWLDRPIKECVELAVAAEAAGLSEVWLPDHYFLRDAFAAQALMAKRTTRIRLGTAVVSPLLRHPALLASSTATINELSGGRAVIGIGVGGFEFGSHLGMTVPRPLSVVRDAVEIVRALSAGEAKVRGRDFTATGAKLLWSAGSFPVYLAARGPRMLELAGEIADGVITHGLAATHLEFCRGRLAAGAARAGRAADACELTMMFDVEIDEDEAGAIDRLRPRCTIMAGGAYSEEMIPIFGLQREDVMPLRAAVRAGDPGASSLVTDDMVRAFSVPGPPGLVAERLAGMAEAGVGRVILFPGGGPVGEAVSRIERLGKAIEGVVGA
jgi:5,10-methylenetetrahydromethanopterin reductase